MKNSFRNIFKKKKNIDIDIEMKYLPELKILQKIKIDKTTEQIIREEIKEREKKMEELHKDMVLLNSTYLMLSKLVDVQQENIDMIIKNVDDVHHNTEKGTEDLKVAYRIIKKHWYY